MFARRGEKVKFNCNILVKHAQIGKSTTKTTTPTLSATHCKFSRGGKVYQTSTCVPSAGQAIWNDEILFPTTLFKKKNGTFEPKVFIVEILQEKRVLYSSSIDLAKYATEKDAVSKYLELHLKQKNGTTGNLLLATLQIIPVGFKGKLPSAENNHLSTSNKHIKESKYGSTIADIPSFGKKVDLHRSFSAMDVTDGPKSKESGNSSPKKPETKSSNKDPESVMAYPEDSTDSQKSIDIHLEGERFSSRDSPKSIDIRLEGEKKRPKFTRDISGALSSIFEKEANLQTGLDGVKNDDADE